MGPANYYTLLSPVIYCVKQNTNVLAFIIPAEVVSCYARQNPLLHFLCIWFFGWKWLTYDHNGLLALSPSLVLLLKYPTKQNVNINGEIAWLMSDCCLTQVSNFSAISWQEHVTFWRDDDIRFVPKPIYCVLAHWSNQPK